ncbi:hypothetical protein AB0G04_39290 [Actinoplanes sp. NPDC023801]|uniref:hypothetical protein n=1 Tax=Actinoplanes sp. NPDC023801 TaxID=3154595 RepID=UPI0033F27E16
MPGTTSRARPHGTRRLTGTTIGARPHSTRRLTEATTRSWPYRTRRLTGTTTRARPHSTRRLTRTTTRPRPHRTRRLTGTAARHRDARLCGTRAVRPDPAVSSGVFLAVRPEVSRRPARPVSPAGTPARTCLLGHRGSARCAPVVAGLRSMLAAAGTLDHARGALGHGAGAAGHHRCAGTLPPGNHRRNHGGCPDRTPVPGTDAARPRHVRCSGEPTGLRFVGIRALMHVPLPARLTPGPALAGPPVNTGSPVGVGPAVPGRGLLAAADHAVCAGVTAGRHERVRTAVGSGLDESM